MVGFPSRHSRMFHMVHFADSNFMILPSIPVRLLRGSRIASPPGVLSKKNVTPRFPRQKLVGYLLIYHGSANLRFWSFPNQVRAAWSLHSNDLLRGSRIASPPSILMKKIYLQRFPRQKLVGYLLIYHGNDNLRFWSFPNQFVVHSLWEISQWNIQSEVLWRVTWPEI